MKILFFFDRFSDQDKNFSLFQTRYRAKEMEEGEEEDHGFRVTKKVGFKDPESIVPKKVGFKEPDFEEDYDFYGGRSYFDNTTAGTSSNKNSLDALDSDSAGSTDRQQSGFNFLPKKGKSVSFKTPSDDDEDLLGIGGFMNKKTSAISLGTTTMTTSDENLIEFEVKTTTTAAGGSHPPEENEKPTFNLRKYFG